MADFGGFSPSELSDDDRIFTARLEDYISSAENKNTAKFSFFLDERLSALSRDILNSRKFHNFLLFGGHPASKRCVLGVFPEFIEPDETMFPVTAVEFTYRIRDKLSHKDFLGALMALKIKRETVGDILVGEGRTVVFIYDTIKDELLFNIEKIGSVGVKAAVYSGTDFPDSEKFLEIDGIIASLRLDCVVSLLTKLSREKASLLIKSDGIDVNYRKNYSTSFLLKQGDIFSVRGYGKFILQEICGKTKKDKVHVTIKKYI